MGKSEFVIGTEFKNVFRGKTAAGEYFHVGHFLDPPDPPIANPCPGVQARQVALMCDPAAHLGARLGKHHIVPSLTQCTRRLEPGWSSSNHKHCIV